EPPQPRRCLWQIAQRDTQGSSGVEQHAQRVAHDARHRQRRNASEAQGSRIAVRASKSRLVAINQRHVGATTQKMPRRANPNNASTDHDDSVAAAFAYFRWLHRRMLAAITWLNGPFTPRARMN